MDALIAAIEAKGWLWESMEAQFNDLAVSDGAQMPYLTISVRAQLRHPRGKLVWGHGQNVEEALRKALDLT